MTPAPGFGPGESPTPEGAAAGVGAPGLPGDLAPARATIYWILGLSLGFVSLLVPAIDAEGILSRSPIGQLEPAAVSLAFVIGALSLVRYYTRREQTYLFIGSGFLATAMLDAFHGAVVSPWWTLTVGEASSDIGPWTWFGGRLFLSTFLAAGVIVWRQESRGDEMQLEGREASIYVLALILSLSIVFVFGLSAFLPGAFELPSAIGSGPFPRWVELIPAAFFTAAFVGYLHKGAWRTDQFEHWLLISLLLMAIGEGAFMSRSAAVGDLFSVLAYVLKLIGYVTVVTGVIISVFVTSRREHAALQAIQGMNATLAREVSVRREAESVLQRSEERLQSFLDTAHDLIQSVGPDGRILYVNRAWEQTLGYTRAELRDLRMGDLIHPEQRVAVMEDFARVLAGEKVGRMQIRLITRDGGVVTCSGSATRHVVEGRAVATQAILRDVTQQRAAEKELAGSRANLAAVIESTGDGIWSVDRKGRLVTFNPAFALYVEARTGREPTQGMLPEEVFTPSEALWYRELYERVLGGERFTERHQEDLGSEVRVYEVTGNPVAGEGGLVGAVMFGKDVTRRVRAEEALRVAKDEAEAANRAKSEFLANMSHELRTPLNSVIGFANILLKNKAGNLTDKDLGFLERILSNGRHLLSLINEVLDLAKVEAGRMELDIEEADLSELVVETVQQLEGQAVEKNVSVLADVPDGEIEPVDTDRPKLKQVLINLVGNALKFSEGGSVTIRLEHEGSRATALAVQDTGIGIPPERLEAIFEAFQQADGSTSRRFGGTGLGLTISRSICQMLGYELTVESEVGVGSTFRIVMSGARRPDRAEGRTAGLRPADPTAAEEEAALKAKLTGKVGPAPAAAESEVERSLREARSKVSEALGPIGRRSEQVVLVIDDESDSRVLMAQHLEELGCQVVTASSAQDGIQTAREVSPDLITLDLMMPEMTGWEALQALKDDEELRRIPVVIVSIVASEGRAKLLGAVDLLNKPVEREDLLRVLWRNLVRKEGNRVLVVEDDADTRELLTQYLESAGLKVDTAENGEEALAAVDRTVPDVVLLDLMMPVMDGMSFLNILRENPYHTGLPVIVLTAKELTGEERAFLAEKASTVIPKGDHVEDRLRDALGAILPLGTDGDDD